MGAGFTEFLTIENPSPLIDCAVNIQYLLGNGISPVIKTVLVVHSSRFTEGVNGDLHESASSSSYLEVSAIVAVDSLITPVCTGVVAERPMYFTNFLGVNSGSDVLGATKTGTTFYFADVPTGGGYAAFITILNPDTAIAHVTASFYIGGVNILTKTIQVPGEARGTIIPDNSVPGPQHAAVIVTSDIPVVVERPEYFHGIAVGNAGVVSGASSVIGMQSLSSDWLFAEGYTGGGFQEYMVLANLSSSTPVSVNVTLEFTNGHIETVAETIAPLDQTFVDVNQIIANHLGHCDTTLCQSTPSVSAEVVGDGNFIAQREMFFHYNHIGNGRILFATGGTDVIGQAGPAAATVFSFAEGYTNVNYDEWLTLQNPTMNPETIFVTLVNADGRVFTQGFTVVAQSRFTADITELVLQHLIVPGDSYKGYEVSIVVQSSNGPFVAERPMYWNLGSSGIQGGSDVVGYIGG